MRRYLTIVCLSLLAFTLQAQKLGIVAGPSLDYGLLSVSEADAYHTTSVGVGLHVGAHFEMDVTNRWGFDAQITYQFRNMYWTLGYPSLGTIERKFHRQTGYLDVPFHFYVNFPLKKGFVLNLFGGPVFTCGLHGHDWAWENTGLKKPVTEMKEKLFDKDKGRMYRCEFALEVGLALKWKNFQGRISYQHSVNNDNNNDYKFTLLTYEAPYMTSGQAKISFAYLFDLRK
ncbi:MAG: outer membrane beta-barrel protein [Paludibacteraceae bacterium]|nr:outer membrane beta-barrel protein [Paludibacteraceae bacterium]